MARTHVVSQFLFIINHSWWIRTKKNHKTLFAVSVGKKNLLNQPFLAYQLPLTYRPYRSPAGTTCLRAAGAAAAASISNCTERSRTWSPVRRHQKIGMWTKNHWNYGCFYIPDFFTIRFLDFWICFKIFVHRNQSFYHQKLTFSSAKLRGWPRGNGTTLPERHLMVRCVKLG